MYKIINVTYSCSHALGHFRVLVYSYTLFLLNALFITIRTYDYNLSTYTIYNIDLFKLHKAPQHLSHFFRFRNVYQRLEHLIARASVPKGQVKYSNNLRFVSGCSWLSCSVLCRLARPPPSPPTTVKLKQAPPLSLLSGTASRRSTTRTSLERRQ